MQQDEIIARIENALESDLIRRIGSARGVLRHGR